MTKGPRRSKTPTNLLREAKRALSDGDVVEGERLALRLISRHRNDPDGWLVLGDALLARNEPDRAARQLATILDVIGPKVRLLAYLFTIACHHAGQKDAAQPWLPFIAMDPGLWEDLGSETNFAFVRDSPTPIPEWRPEIA